MKIFSDYNFKGYNTFHVSVKASKFIIVENNKELVDLFNQGIFNGKYIVLGGGSNILFTRDYDGTVLKIDSRGIKVVEESNDLKHVESYAGEDWDIFVEKTLTLNAYGLENLSLIPGSVGASVVQNIGAYGVEAKDFVTSVEYFNVKDGKFYALTNPGLKFNYRNSIFKNELKDVAIVTKVVFGLNKEPKLKLEYADVQKEIEKRGLDAGTINPIQLRNLVIDIRNLKLPNPNFVGNAGSFFKNPIVENEKVSKLQTQYSDIKVFPIDEFKSKIAAGWLIEKAGWKGWTSENGKYGVSSNHALVIVNYSDATGDDILQLASKIKTNIKEKFDIELEEEVILV